MKLLIALAAASALYGADCEHLASLKLKDTTIAGAHAVAAGAFANPAARGGRNLYADLPAFCRVEGVLRPAADSEIRFEVWLPSKGWNGKLFVPGNGGFAGSVLYPMLAAALRNGYAAASTDTGHEAPANNADWALNHPEKITDFAYRSIHETTDRSKRVVEAFYGSNARHAYFSGCSNGGRYALLEAQRYPADFDGIIAGAAENFWTHNIAGFIWDEQALDGAAIPPEKMPAIEHAALAACDARDGVKDGVIDDPTKCHFDPATIVCKGAESNSCLTAAQAAALQKIYQGPRNSKGDQIFPGYLPGGETGNGGWPRWVTGPDAQQPAYAFGFFGIMANSDPKWDFRTFNWDRDMKPIDEKWSRVFNATDANLKPFADRGGKLLIYHGWSDTAISPVNAVNYYSGVVEKMGRQKADQFVELFMVPGMQHCAGGPGPSTFGSNPTAVTDPEHSMFSALDRWVTEGAAPKQIITTKAKTAASPERTRPLCPYPQVAKYKGSGSTDEAANFVCAAP